MGLFAKFSSKEVDQFARTLAQDLAKRYPPSIESSPEKNISQNRVARMLEEAYAKAVDFHQTHNLGVYRKAKLGNTFRWELTELGYSKSFVELATEGLVVYITRKGPAAAEAKSKR